MKEMLISHRDADTGRIAMLFIVVLLMVMALVLFLPVSPIEYW